MIHHSRYYFSSKKTLDFIIFKDDTIASTCTDMFCRMNVFPYAKKRGFSLPFGAALAAPKGLKKLEARHHNDERVQPKEIIHLKVLFV